jgi:hypothetical protein
LRDGIEVETMGYYQGDFYSGARGDPGFFGVIGSLAKSALGFMPGGAMAQKVLTAGSVLSKTRVGALASRGLGAMAKHPVLSAAGAAGAMGMGAAGVHMMRRGKVTAMPGAFGRRHRRMNVCNSRALRRAIRRTHGFAKLAKKVLRFTEAHPRHGRMTFKPVKRVSRKRRAA